ncbi:MAG TPA: hypothetical protein VH475_23555 [Tepidisphaeraceae bacterium]|jgi:hypothetical protein
MATPRYVVKRIGNDYRILPADAQGVVLSALPLAAGGLLALKGLFRGGVLGQLMLLGGSGLMYYGATGKNPIEEIRNLVNQQVQQFTGGSGDSAGEEHGPSHQHDEKADSHQVAQDEIDEASMESFPASDPPAHSRTTASV